MRFLNKPLNSCIALAAVWCITQTIIFLTLHTGTVNEAEKYIGQANSLLINHRLDNRKYIFYFLPIFIIYISLAAKMGYTLAFGIQLLVNAVATAAFYTIARNLPGSNGKAAVATLLYITFIPLQQWTCFLYTESLFYSFCVFFIYACTVMQPDKALTHVARIIVLLLLVFCRPLGLFLIPVLGWLYVAEAGLPAKIKWAIAVAAPVLVYLLLNFLYSSGGGLDILLPQQQGMVICTDAVLPVNNTLNLPQTNNPVNNLILFIFYNPVYFSRLAFYRLLSFFNLTRSFYSGLHNAYFAACMLFFYGFAAISFLHKANRQHKMLIYIFIPLVILLCGGVMLQCNEYNSRFSLTLFPWFILFASNGFFTLLDKRKKTPLT